MFDECKGCACLETCPTVCQPGSLLCMSKRMGSKQTKAQQMRAAGEYRPILDGNCKICGKPLRIIEGQKFCNNMNCPNRFADV